MKKDISLVLGSGGARGIAHIGVIEELVEQGFNIKSISGTSMGALVGGLYATGHLEIYKKWMRGLDKRDVFNLLDFTLSRNGLVKGEKVIKEMEKMIPDRNIEDLSIPFAAVATDVTNEKEVVFKSGSLYDAIRASISIPTVFIPVEKDSAYLVDGGVLNPIPIDRVERTKNDILVVSDVNARVQYSSKMKKNEKAEDSKKYSEHINAIISKLNSQIPKHSKDKLGYINLLDKTTSIMLHKISQLTLEKYNPDILINFPREAFGTYDFYKTQEIIDLGRKYADIAIAEYLNKSH